jgi:hypothetical protein
LQEIVDIRIRWKERLFIDAARLHNDAKMHDFFGISKFFLCAWKSLAKEPDFISSLSIRTTHCVEFAARHAPEMLLIRGSSLVMT